MLVQKVELRLAARVFIKCSHERMTIDGSGASSDMLRRPIYALPSIILCIRTMDPWVTKFCKGIEPAHEWSVTYLDAYYPANNRLVHRNLYRSLGLASQRGANIGSGCGTAMEIVGCPSNFSRSGSRRAK